MRDTIDMAREAGMPPAEIVTDKPVVYPVPEAIERFADLVRADEREKYEAIIASMTKLLEAQQKREGAAIDMIAASAAAEHKAVLDTIDELMGMECDRHPMFSDGYDHALQHIAQFVRGKGNA